MKTTDARKLNQQTQYELRKQVVRLKEKGENNATISEIVGLSQSHISTIWQKYQRGGPDAIKRDLPAEQEAAIQNLLGDKTPDQL
jgi:transposase